jgi:hypothetical protein
MYCSVFASVHPPIVSNYLANLSTEPIYLSSQPIHPSVFPSNYLSFPLSIHVSIELPISRVVHLLFSIHPFFHPCVYLSLCLSLCLLHLTLYSSICASFCQPIFCRSMYLVHVPICLCVYLSVVSIRLFLYPSVRLSTHPSCLSCPPVHPYVCCLLLASLYWHFYLSFDGSIYLPI